LHLPNDFKNDFDELVENEDDPKGKAAAESL